MFLRIVTSGSTLEARWKRIQKAALTVTLLSQRDEDSNERLWYFPASLFEELQTLAPPDSLEAGSKAKPLSQAAFGRFGNPSITVSWKALVAIEAVTGSRPVASREVIPDLVHFQSPDGAYGSKVPRHPGYTYTINDCARHTAMALLIQMSFGSEQSSTSILGKFERLVRWLVGPAGLEEGGWAFEQSERSQKQGLGPTSTASCIMALSKFVQMCDRENLPHDLYELIRQKVVRSLAALVETSTSGTWDLRNEGLPLETRVAESAYIISCIRHAIRHGALEELEPQSMDILRKLQLGLISVGVPLKHGWPSGIGGLSISPAATVCALHALSDLDIQELPNEARELLGAAEQRMLSDVCRDNGWEFLRGWDWATLAELSIVKIGPMSPFESNKLFKKVSAVKVARSHGHLNRFVLRGLPAESRMPVEYCLTRGQRVAMNETMASKFRASTAEFLKKSSWSVWTTLVGIAVLFLLSKFGLK